MEKLFSPITVNLDKGIYKNEVSGKMEVELRQEVVTSYPSIKLSNNLSEALFTEAEAGIKKQSFTETRVAWQKVGNITDIDAVITKLADLNAKLYRVLSLNPILTDSDKSAITAELTTKENIASKQLLVNNTTQEPILYEGKLQYRRIFYSNTSIEDVDYRVEQLAKIKLSSIQLVEEKVN